MALLSIGYFGERMDIYIRQGGTFGPMHVTMLNPDLTPVDLTGCTIRGQVREAGVGDTMVADIEVTVTDELLGMYDFGIPADDTEDIAVGLSVAYAANEYVWDLEMEDSIGQIIPLYYGYAIVKREATRP